MIKSITLLAIMAIAVARHSVKDLKSFQPEEWPTVDVWEDDTKSDVKYGMCGLPNRRFSGTIRQRTHGLAHYLETRGSA
ncbi:MAG: hypothetical protein ACLUE2_02725 [Bacteroides cellulosilyticus]